MQVAKNSQEVIRRNKTLISRARRPTLSLLSLTSIYRASLASLTVWKRSRETQSEAMRRDDLGEVMLTMRLGKAGQGWGWTGRTKRGERAVSLAVTLTLEKRGYKVQGSVFWSKKYRAALRKKDTAEGAMSTLSDFLCGRKLFFSFLFIPEFVGPE